MAEEGKKSKKKEKRGKRKGDDRKTTTVEEEKAGDVPSTSSLENFLTDVRDTRVAFDSLSAAVSRFNIKIREAQKREREIKKKMESFQHDLDAFRRQQRIPAPGPTPALAPAPCPDQPPRQDQHTTEGDHPCPDIIDYTSTTTSFSADDGERGAPRVRVHRSGSIEIFTGAPTTAAAATEAGGEHKEN